MQALLIHMEKIRKNSNIRIAPSFPTPEDLGKAAEVFVLCVKLTSVEKLLATVADNIPRGVFVSEDHRKPETYRANLCD